MNGRAASTEARRELLRRRCAAQREQLHQAVAGIQGRLRSVDRVLLVVRRLRIGPALFAAAAAVVAGLPMYRSIGRALTVVRTLRGLLPSRR